MVSKIGIKYIAPADTTGYSVAARGYLDAIAQSGIPLTWQPLVAGTGLGLWYEPGTPQISLTPRVAALCARRSPYDRVIIHTIPEYYPHFVAEERRLGGEGVQIWGQTVWETDKLPKHWPALLAPLDGIIVPTEWNKQVFRESGLTQPILVLPHLSQFEGRPALEADRRPLPDLSGRLIFYCISTWMERKGISMLLEAFSQAFTARDPVALVLKTTPYDLERRGRSWRHGFRSRAVSTASLVAPVQKRRGAPEIILLTGEYTDGEIQALHAAGDCYVSLTRGEGWGLGAFEAAWFGHPVIMTGFGGQTDFLPPALARLVNWTPVPVQVPVLNPCYTPDQHWAEPDINDAVRHLQAVFEDPFAARQQGARLAEYVSTRFAAPAVLQKIEQLWAPAE